ncbi:maltose ABC transporter substrate-binding protein [Boudabousia liubingyangii]|uniref:Maltose ABC transporter substrate-binding protein n=1 Tax=Boudabousia liubingyangii TaxID=1921764 RepID=A0A1Q5PN63_9ACTO|nr:maltose ABC transporter substrate-binding protein [Boudabousia liubingyangii]OKL48905.1 maltose ABC transporter substrate-binding protein [Boudabousia liubingyangii]
MRRGIAMTTVGALALTLAACGGTETKPADNQTATSTAEAGGEAVAGELTIWADDTRSSQVKELAADFTKEYGVKVNVVQKSESDMNKEFISQVPTGKGPDLIVLAHDRLGELVANGVVGTVDIADKAGQFSEAALAGVTYQGQTYGVPYAIENVALVRNNKLTKAEPKTFDEMIAEGKKANVEYPFIVQMGDKGDPYHFYGFQTSFGAPVFKQDDKGSYTTELALGGDNGKKFAQWLAKEGNEKVFDPAISGEIAKQAFLDGKAAFTVTGPWNTGAFREANMDITVLPIPQAGDQPAQPFVGVQAFFPSAKTQNQLLVNKFLIDYLATPAAQQKMYDIGKRVPAMPEVASKISDPDVQGFSAAGEKGAPMPAIPEMSAVWDFWGVTEADIVTGKQAADAAWDTMVKNIEGAISKK